MAIELSILKYPRQEYSTFEILVTRELFLDDVNLLAKADTILGDGSALKWIRTEV